MKKLAVIIILSAQMLVGASFSPIEKSTSPMEIFNCFGDYNTGHGIHNAIDIFGEKDSKVYAINSGTVEYYCWTGLGTDPTKIDRYLITGILINGIAYQHLAGVKVDHGQILQAGDLIGVLDGNRHLHFGGFCAQRTGCPSQVYRTDDHEFKGLQTNPLALFDDAIIPNDSLAFNTEYGPAIMIVQDDGSKNGNCMDKKIWGDLDVIVRASNNLGSNHGGYKGEQAIDDKCGVFKIEYKIAETEAKSKELPYDTFWEFSALPVNYISYGTENSKSDIYIPYSYTFKDYPLLTRGSDNTHLYYKVTNKVNNSVKAEGTFNSRQKETNRDENASISKAARYKDGKMWIYVKIYGNKPDKLGGSLDKTDDGYTIDNFRPFIEKVEAIQDDPWVTDKIKYSKEWKLSTDESSISIDGFEPKMPDFPVEATPPFPRANPSDYTVNITFSEPVKGYDVNVLDPDNGNANLFSKHFDVLAEEGQVYFSVRIPSAIPKITPGVKNVSIAATDLAGNKLLNTTLASNTIQSSDVGRDENGNFKDNGGVDAMHRIYIARARLPWNVSLSWEGVANWSMTYGFTQIGGTMSYPGNNDPLPYGTVITGGGAIYRHYKDPDNQIGETIIRIGMPQIATSVQENGVTYSKPVHWEVPDEDIPPPPSGFSGWPWQPSLSVNMSPTAKKVKPTPVDATVAELDFDTVNSDGYTSDIDANSTAPAVPVDYNSNGKYDLFCSAAYTGNVTVSMKNDAVSVRSRILQLAGGKWNDITTGVSTATKTVTAVTAGLGPKVQGSCFALVTYKDDVPPVTTVSSISGNVCMNSDGRYFCGYNANITLNATDNSSGVFKTYYLQPTSMPGFTEYTGQFSVIPPQSITDYASRPLVFYSVDKAGNTETWENYSVIIDVSPPVPSVCSRSGYTKTYKGITYLDPGIIDITAYDQDKYMGSYPIPACGVKQITYNINGGADKTYTTALTCSLGDVIKFSATDRVNNQSASFTGKVTGKDVTPPVSMISFSKPPYFDASRAKYFTTSVTRISLSATDDITGVNRTLYRIDVGGAATYTTPFTLAQEGQKTIGYLSVDEEGNSETEKNYALIIDNTPPATTISFALPSFTTTNGTFVTSGTKVTLSASDALSGASKLDWALIPENGTVSSWNEVSAGTTTITIPNFGVDGRYDLYYYSKDQLDNSEVPKIAKVIIDNTQPSGTAKFNDGATCVGSGEAVLDLTSSDNAGAGVTSVSYSLDSGAWQTEPVFSSKNISLTNDGKHTVSVKFIDALGNTSAPLDASVKFCTAGSLMVDISGVDPADAAVAETITLKVSARKQDGSLYLGYSNKIEIDITDNAAVFQKNYTFTGLETESVALIPIQFNTAGKLKITVKDTELGSVKDGILNVNVYKVQSIGPSGGTIALDDGTAVVLPSGSVSLGAEFTIKSGDGTARSPGQARLYGMMQPIARVFGVLDRSTVPWSIKHIEFPVPVRIGIPFLPGELNGIAKDKLRIYWYNDSTNRYEIVEGRQEVTDGTVFANVKHFSTYAILGSSLEADLSGVVVFPNPVSKSGAVGGTVKIINMPQFAVASIYTITGEKVAELKETDMANPNSGWLEWDFKNTAGETVARGIYVCIIAIPDGGKKLVKIAVTK